VNLSLAQDVPKDPTGCVEVADGPVAGASVNVRLSPRPRPPATETEAELAELDVLLSAKPDDRAPLLARRAELRMQAYFARHPYLYAVRGDVGEGGGGDADEVEVQALRIGATAIVGIPGEPFLGIAEEVRRRSGLKHVMVAGYANEAIGYIPLATEFGLGGYEVGCARFTPEAASSMVEGALSALAAATNMP
jgi:hypothetical protein